MERRHNTGAGGVKTVQWLGGSLWGPAGMFAGEVYAAVRHFVFVEGNSRREADIFTAMLSLAGRGWLQICGIAPSVTLH